MRLIASAAVAVAAIAASGCSSYHPAALSATPHGPAALHDRAATDRSLQQRYPLKADIAESRFPQGAHVPAARPAGQDWGVNSQPGWSTTPLGREAERRTIARDMPHASVTPWGTVKGH